MSLLFGRASIFQVGEAGGQSRSFGLEQDPSTGLIRQVRTHFHVENSSVGQVVNKASVALFNLSQDSRNFIEQLSVGKMTLQAGYNPKGILNPVLPIIFSGDVFWVSNKREGADIITTIESGMALDTITDAIVNFSQESPMSPSQLLDVIKKACGDLGIAVGDIDPSFLAGNPFLQGLCFQGPLWAFLNEVINPTNLLHTIQDNTLFIFDPHKAPVLQDVLLTKDTGMIGVPTTSAGNAAANPDDIDDKYPIFTVKSLFNPLLVPGRQVKVQSIDSKYNGYFTIRIANHEGDTYEGPWDTDLEGQWVASSIGARF